MLGICPPAAAVHKSQHKLLVYNCIDQKRQQKMQLSGKKLLVLPRFSHEFGHDGPR